MEARGRGRARGRARGAQQQVPGGSQGPGPGSLGLPQQMVQPGRDPWNRPTRPQQATAPVQHQTPTQWVRPQMPAPASSAGRGSRLGGPDTVEVSGAAEYTGSVQVPQGGGDYGAQSRGGGNGGVRGRNLRNEIIFTRPQALQTKQGSTGKPIQLISNYFKLIQAGKWCLLQYRVDFNPDVDHTGMRKKFLKQALQGVLQGYLFDGTVLYASQRINPEPLEKFVESESGENIRITVRLVGDVAWGDYHYIQIFNIIIRNCLKHMKLQLIQRDYFDPFGKVAIPEFRLELWPGYFTSMRQHEADILMNCELIFKFMRTDNVYDMHLECKNSINYKNEFQSRIIGNVVLTYYNNKTYKVDDIDFSRTPESTFSRKDGSQMTFIQYYQEKYNIRIQITDQPLLVSRSKPREIRAGMPELILLIPELCQLTGLTDRQRENFQLMRALSDHTRVGPSQRMQKLEEFSNRLRQCPEAVSELRKWDFKLTDRLINFQGRILPQEQILGGNNAKYSSGPQADWTRELRSLPMFYGAKMSKFAVVCPVKFKNSCQDFLQCLQRSAKGMQWNMSQPRIFDIPDDRANSYLDTIEHLISKNNPDMIMCVVPNNSSDRYSAIKKKCCVDRGVPTQVILAKNLTSKGVMSIATKVAIQLNCKVGGAPWSVLMPLSNLMVVGYDVCRDTSNKGKSFAAMVASLDKQITRYFNLTSEHQLEEELSENFGAFLILACHRYKEINGRFPDRILIYRDAVGDGQLPYVIETEVENIKRKLTQEIYKNGDLKMAFIVVSKRINTRIFTDRGENPPPGTVVDDVITLPERYDFFIVSQCVRQGTVSPTSYNVISDSMGLSPDKLQILTYKLCHMYYNWSGTVRVPAPCQYAHKLAALTAQSLHRTANRTLENILYYL
ncbi:piwi-like protein Siwi [Diorhabda sublineata]|uniref:piwi-like protein Siwi n=1 Tax=Diorhabda sublineata TaxID=1163346 RepID=UPI0024E0B6C9|nr:piwi-like protein Siwi [Diorhabda sublineata]XP_056630153.1 piwi-like protein Siwi [Diorhabda sublineata]